MSQLSAPLLGQGKRRYLSNWLLTSLTSRPNFSARAAEPRVPTSATQNPVRVREGPSLSPGGSPRPPPSVTFAASGRGTSTDTGESVRLSGRLCPAASVNSCFVVV